MFSINSHVFQEALCTKYCKDVAGQEHEGYIKKLVEDRYISRTNSHGTARWSRACGGRVQGYCVLCHAGGVREGRLSTTALSDPDGISLKLVKLIYPASINSIIQ